MAIDLNSLSKEELIEKLENLYRQPYIQRTIETLIDKIDEVNDLFDQTTIDVTSDQDRSFANFVSWGEKVIKIADSINVLLERLDPEIRAEMKRKVEIASDVSLEGMIKTIKRKK